MNPLSIGKLIDMAQEMEMAATALAMFRKDNDGTQWLHDNFPHLLSQLDEMTLNWVLVPKSVVANVTILDKELEVYRENLKIGCPTLPDGVTVEEYQDRMNKLLDFIETQIRPALERMPERQKEGEPVAFAEEFEGEELGGDTDDDG